MSTTKIIRYFIRAIGICLLVIIILRLDVHQTLSILKDTNWTIVFIAIALNIPMLFIKTLRWHTFILAYDTKYKIKEAFLAYLSSLTNSGYSATQYAMLSSIVVLLPKFIAGFSGEIVNALGYVNFFIFASLIGLPVLVLIKIVEKQPHPS